MAPQTTSIFGKDELDVLARPTHLALLAASSLKQDSDMYITNSKLMEKSSPIEDNPTIHVLVDENDQTEVEEEEEQEEEWKEERLIIQMSCSVERLRNSKELSLKLLLRLEDSMNRQLNKTVTEDQTGMELAADLLFYGLINEIDLDKVANTIQEGLDNASVR